VRNPTYLYFPLDEFRTRLDALRGRMATAGVDALVLHGPENVYLPHRSAEMPGASRAWPSPGLAGT
jgi:hypothetical protein